MSRRESRPTRREARRDVGGDGGRRGDRGARGIDWQKQRKGSVHQLQQATSRWRSSSRLDVLGAKNPWNLTTMSRSCSHGREDGDWEVGESATKGVDKQSVSRAGSAWRTGCIMERMPQSAPRSYGCVSDWGPSSTRDEQRWASMSKSPCSTRAAERRRCGDLRPSLYWKGLFCIARQSWLYWARWQWGTPPGTAQRALGIAQAVTP